MRPLPGAAPRPRRRRPGAPSSAWQLAGVVAALLCLLALAAWRLPRLRRAAAAALPDPRSDFTRARAAPAGGAAAAGRAAAWVDAAAQSSSRSPPWEAPSARPASPPPTAPPPAPPPGFGTSSLPLAPSSSASQPPPTPGAPLVALLNVLAAERAAARPGCPCATVATTWAGSLQDAVDEFLPWLLYHHTLGVDEFFVLFDGDDAAAAALLRSVRSISLLLVAEDGAAAARWARFRANHWQVRIVFRTIEPTESD